MEVQVLDGAQETLTRHKPTLFAEALDEKSTFDLKNKMSELNYCYVQSHCLTPMLEFRPKEGSGVRLHKGTGMDGSFPSASKAP